MARGRAPFLFLQVMGDVCEGSSCHRTSVVGVFGEGCVVVL